MVHTFGKIRLKGDVTSSVHRALDGRHFMSFDEDDSRTGYTLLNSPVHLYSSGEDLEQQQKQS